MAQTWPRLLATNLVYKVLTFVVLAPLMGLVLQSFLSTRGTSVLADQDILFFVLSPAGMLTSLIVGVVTIAILTLEQACLMSIGFGETQNLHVRATDALIFGARKSWPVVLLSFHILVRVLLIALPFLAVSALISLTLLREHDINFYLAYKPPVFVAAVGFTTILLGVTAVLVIRRLLSWSLALPLILFEDLPPIQALATSTERTMAHKTTVGITLVAWAAGTALLSAVPIAVVGSLAHWIVPKFANSVTLLVIVIGSFLLLWGLLNLLATLINESMFALLTVDIYGSICKSSKACFSSRTYRGGTATINRQRLSLKWAIVGLVSTAALAAAIGQIMLDRVSFDDDVIVIAHRGAAKSAPENTLAAVNLAVEQGADMVEIDVQESSDGEIVVIHDSDLMRVGGTPVKIWEATYLDLSEVDIGSWSAPEFAGERVPTLKQVLEICKGRAHVDIELKSYGHNDRLEERVAEIVEAMDMEEEVVLMSLESSLVSSMKELRPQWTVGLLTAKAVGDLTTSDADFLAVHLGIAQPGFVRRAHRAGKEVYVWTVNDKLNMSRMMSWGVDGIITDDPALARTVIEQRAKLSSAERLMLTAAFWIGLEPREPPPERDAG